MTQDNVMMKDDIIPKYQTIKESIQVISKKANRDASKIKLIAVSKNHTVNEIKPLLEQGHCNFGENRVQEAKSKWVELKKQYSHVILHLIGPLQTNKVKEAVQLFDVIETVDREKVAKKLSEEIQKTGKKPICFIQVNIGNETQKSGISQENLEAFLHQCRNEYHLNIQGLMCIPPVNEDSRKYFMLLYNLAQKHGLTEISMGMSNDFEEAILSGATQVRIGSAIFGPRKYI